MELYIDTSDNKETKLALKKGERVLFVKTFASEYRQSELLLREINRLLKSNKIKLTDIEKIAVNNRGDSFSSLRIGVVTANALAYALGVGIKGTNGKELNFGKHKLVKAIYNKEPNIG